MTPLPAPPRRTRFGLGSLFLLMLVCSATAAGAYYAYRAFASGARGDQFQAILFTVAAPMLLLVAARLIRAASQAWGK